MKEHTMTHMHFQELISLHVDNELTDTQSAELFAHLATCDGCRKFMRTTIRIRSHISGQELAEVSQVLDQRVLKNVTHKTIRETKREWLAPFWWTRIIIPLPAAASLALLIIIGSLLVSPILVSQKSPQQRISAEEIAKVPPEIRKQLDMYR
jgi:anti-sigma factor RsiW